MLPLLKNTTFSTFVHRASDIIKKARTIFETSDARLSDSLYDVKQRERKMMSDRSSRNGSEEENPDWPGAS